MPKKARSLLRNNSIILPKTVRYSKGGIIVVRMGVCTIRSKILVVHDRWTRSVIKRTGYGVAFRGNGLGASSDGCLVPVY
jgi:hypothetical protein